MDSFRSVAPVRADLAGGTLDLWPLYCLWPNAKTINVALDMPATVHFEIGPAVAPKVEVRASSGEGFELEESLSPDELVKVPQSLRFPVTVVNSYLGPRFERMNEKMIRIRIETRAPMGSGLGGSSTLCVALVRGLSRLFSEYVELGWQWKMLDWVKDVEAGFIHTPTGTQDYLAALFGGLNTFVSRTGGIDSVPLPASAFDGISDRLVVLFSGQMHSSGLSNWELFKKALEGDSRVLGGLSRIRDIAENLDRELRRDHTDWKKVGSLMSDEWSVRQETFKVDTPRLEEIVKFLRGQDILGCKVCGAAQGGSLIALVEPSKRAALKTACREKGIEVLEAPCTRQGVTVVDERKSAHR